ncbi:TPR-like protein [Aspergillus terreus]|uniref:TPR-like protein n=1 Tax=Aspergillus terreus TaxID=33178 RepID=A0A5M3YXK5_ASPTE|nr:hypothetical protein ATETN484_0003080700 [Aspergillus terreus]GFF14793.1 TPR-like protein [Aspergillus terreus]
MQFLNILFFFLRTLKVSFLREKPETFNQRQSSFNFTVKSWIYLNFYPISENELMSYWVDEAVKPILPLVNQQQIRTVSQIFYAVSICSGILAVELGITWNSLTGVGPHDILSTSQLIPFLVGLLSLFQVVSDLSLKKYNVLDQEEMMAQASEAKESGYTPYEPEDDTHLNQLVQHYSQNLVVGEESNANGKERAKQHNRLALALGSRYERHGYIADFDEAITHSAKAISLDDESMDCQMNMGVLLRVRWQKTNDLQDLDKAIAHLEFMKRRQGLTRAELVNILDDLIRFKKERRTATDEGPDSLIEPMEELYSLMWHEYSRKAPDCLILSELLWEKYEQGGREVVVLRKAIFYAKESVKATGDNFWDKAIRLNSWTQKLLDSYRSTRKGILLRRAIEYEKRAESSLTDGQSQGADAYYWLGKLLAELYEKEKDGHIIKEAISQNTKQR